MSDRSLAVVPADNQPANTPAVTPAPYFDDPDQRELEEARAAVAAEEAARSGQAPAPTPAPASPPAAATPASPATSGTPTVPLARFNEMAQRAKRAEEAAAYHAGALAALKEQQVQAPANTAPTAPVKPPEYVEAEAIQAEWEAAAAEYDNGAISAVEFAQKQMPLMGRMLRLHVTTGMAQAVQQIEARLASHQAQPGLVDQQVMREQMVALGASHPWSTVMNEREAAALVQMARAEDAALGRSTYAPGPAGTMALRKRVAELASLHMPEWHAGEQPPAAASAPPATQPQPSAAAPANGARPTPADYERAMQRQAAHPPTTPSSHGQATGPITLDRIDTMSDAELERMPAAERQRLLGVST